jgi:membrane fusion protein (multidrug efflux system)
VTKAILGIILLFFILAGIKGWQIFAMVSAPQPVEVVTVTSASVKQETWAPILTSVGTVTAVQGTVVSTELGGTVREIAFESGAPARKGDLLLKLDTSAEEAQLRAAEADLEWARADLERARGLAANKVVSKAELDSVEARLKQKEATVDNMRAIIARKTVRAPFDGQLGIRQVNLGQMINAGQQVAPLQSLDPVYVDFALPQQRLAQLSNGLDVEVRTDAMPGRKFVGKLTAINSTVDAVTRNVGVQATLQNSDHALRPGMFARIDVVLPAKQPALVIPGTAVSYAPYGDSVFVIEKKKDEKSGKESQVIRSQLVRVGEARGDLVSVTKGLKPGEIVVGTGVFKLRNGQTVTIDNTLAPTPEIAPTPADT